jgi:hypothetical protein
MQLLKLSQYPKIARRDSLNFNGLTFVAEDFEGDFGVLYILVGHNRKTV